MKKIILCTSLILSGCSVFAQNENDKNAGVSAIANENYKKAYHLWLPLAQKGDKEVQEAIGLLLMSDKKLGLTISRQKRDKQSLLWMKRSAYAGHLSAIEWLSDAYKFGWLGLVKSDQVSSCFEKSIKDNSRLKYCKELELKFLIE